MSDVLQNDWIDDGNRNRWRYHTGTNNEIIDIELTRGKFSMCMFSHFDRIQQIKWASKRKVLKTHTNWYAQGHMRDNSSQQFIMVYMHSWLYPNVPGPIDHIDHDGLNNTISNIRSGSHGINPRNKINAIGVSKNKYGYTAHWTEADGTKKSRKFAHSKYDDAYVVAIAYREENASRAFNEKLVIQRNNPLPPSIIPIIAPRRVGKSPIQTRITGLSYYDYRNMPHIIGRILINGKYTSKRFSLSMYGNDMETAKEAGVDWLAKMRLENSNSDKK